MGAWIEICDDVDEAALSYVAPLVGAWIEIKVNACAARAYESLLSWERGMKFINSSTSLSVSLSLLSWERGLKYFQKAIDMRILSRSSRGSVD